MCRYALFLLARSHFKHCTDFIGNMSLFLSKDAADPKSNMTSTEIFPTSPIITVAFLMVATVTACGLIVDGTAAALCSCPMQLPLSVSLLTISPSMTRLVAYEAPFYIMSLPLCRTCILKVAHFVTYKTPPYTLRPS